jgi:glycosyltransferase involved in cell wall biosynthesis
MAASNARKLIGVSPILQKYFADNYGVDAEFIPNGVMPMQHQPPGRMLQYGIEPRKFLFSVSRLVPEKGLHYLIPAFESLDTDFKLVIAGGGGFDADYERSLHEMAGERVVFLGPADRDFVAELFSHAQLFVLPSDLEGMSIALLEAMNMGVPVLVSDIPENVCVVEEAGFTFRAGDVEHLSGVLADILAKPARLAEYSRRAAEQVAPFQWPAVVDQLEQVYYDCCGRRPAAIPAQSSTLEYNSEPPVAASTEHS